MLSIVQAGRKKMGVRELLGDRVMYNPAPSRDRTPLRAVHAEHPGLGVSSGPDTDFEALLAKATGSS